VNAQLYESCLDKMGYAPDILHLVDDGSLKDIGIKPGDIIRLKQHSLQWLNSSASKRKQDDHAPLGASIPPNKRVRFEKQYHDGGSSRVYGPRIVRVEDDAVLEELAFEWVYFCEAREAWVPIPVGLVPVLEHEVDT